MTKHDLKELAAIGAELGAAKAENERLRGLLRECAGQIDLLIEVYVEDDVEPEDIAISEQIKADIHAALSQQAEPCVFHDSDREACQQYSGQVPCEPAPAQDEQAVAAVIGFYEGEREPRLLSWNVLPNGEHRLYTRPAQTEQQPVAWRRVVERLIANVEIFDERPRPMCRDCADRNGICESGLDCDIRALVKEARAMIAAPIAQTAPNSDCEWCAGAGKDHFGEKCEHCQAAPLRYTNDGSLAECPCCGSLDVGGAHDTVHCYRCGLTVTKPRPLKNAIDAWNMRTGKQTAPQPEQSGLADLPYQPLFDAIAAATDAGEAPISISVKAFRAALSAQGQSNGDS